MLIVQVCDFGDDGDARYRLHDPCRYLSRLPDVTAIDCHFFSRHLKELAERADVLVLQFVNNWDLLETCERRRAAGRVTVFEANDYFFDFNDFLGKETEDCVGYAVCYIYADKKMPNLKLKIGSDDQVRPPEEWKGATSLEAAIADPVKGQDTTLADPTLLGG